MVQLMIIATLFCGSIGIMLFVIGSIFTAVVALGNQQKWYGWVMLIFMPLSLWYCARNWDKAAYSGKMVFSGTFLLLVTALFTKFMGLY